MKKITAIFLTVFLLFAQDNAPVADDILPQALDTLETQAQTESIEDTASAQTVDTADSTVSAQTGAAVSKIFFIGVQTGDIPELRETFDDMIRTKWGTESGVEFVSKDVSMRIRRKLFSDKRIYVDSLLFAELRKHNLENTVLLLVSVNEYSISAVRNLLVFGEVEGKMDVGFVFYDVSNKKELFVTHTSGVSKIKKGLIGFKSPRERVNINAGDRRKINSELLDYAVKNGFDMMKIAVSLKK